MFGGIHAPLKVIMVFMHVDQVDLTKSSLAHKSGINIEGQILGCH